MTRRSRVAGLIAALLVNCGPGYEFGPNEIVVSDPEAFVREALALIEKRRTAVKDEQTWVDEEHLWIDDAQLPPSLRIQKVALPRRALMIASLRVAHVAPDHLDLLLLRATDGHGGARVWAAKSRPHRDTPTRYKDIYFFFYDEESPVSPENIR